MRDFTVDDMSIRYCESQMEQDRLVFSTGLYTTVLPIEFDRQTITSISRGGAIAVFGSSRQIVLVYMVIGDRGYRIVWHMDEEDKNYFSLLSAVPDSANHFAAKAAAFVRRHHDQ